MKILSIVLTGVLALAFATSATAADNKKLLMGKWEAVKSEPDTLPVGATIEFKAEGKMTMVMGKDGKDFTIEGTYTVDGDTFTISRKKDDKESTYKITIKKISETELETANPEGKGVTFKRVK